MTPRTNTRPFFGPSWLIALVSLAACGSGAKPAPIDLAKYDHACTVDADCVVVENDPCAVCPCPKATINAKDKAAFTADLNAAAAQCPADPGPVPPCVSCQATASCKNAVCTVATDR